jgi:hypothetical protein
MKTFLWILGCVVLLSSCSSTKGVVDPVKAQQLKEWIDNKQLTIYAKTASPIATAEMNQLNSLLVQGSTPNHILLTGGQDYFRMSGDSIAADLPYYGVRQLGGEYNQKRGGIKFKGVYNSYKVDYNEKKQMYTLRYRINDNRESFNVVVKIFTNWKANMYINTSHRTAINYQGHIKETDTAVENQ